MSAAIQPDLKRVKLLETPFKDIHQYFSPKSSKLRRVWYRVRHQFRKFYFTDVPPWRMALRTVSGHPRAIPDFASIGAARSGTSALSEYILQHPCVVLPISKEPMPYGFTRRHVLAYFPKQRAMEETRERYGIAMTGYCAPTLPLLWWPHIAKATNPQLKIVLILRNPVERTHSQWRWDQAILARWQKDPLWQHFPKFDDAVALELQSLREGGGGFRTFSGTASGYLLESLYLPFIRTMIDTFGRDRIEFLGAEEFFAEPIATAQRVYRFLGLPDYDPVLVTERNSAPVGSMSEATRQNLTEFFEPHNRRLYEFLGRDFGWSNTRTR